MKVLMTNGSPRKGGNSDILCDEFAAGAKEAGNIHLLLCNCGIAHSLFLDLAKLIIAAINFEIVDGFGCYPHPFTVFKVFRNLRVVHASISTLSARTTLVLSAGIATCLHVIQ